MLFVVICVLCVVCSVLIVVCGVQFVVRCESLSFGVCCV